MGVIGDKQAVSAEHFPDVFADLGLGNAPGCHILIGNAGEVLDHWGDGHAGSQGDQLVIFPGHFHFAAYLLHHNGGKFDDLVPAEIQTGGFCVEKHQLIVFLKQTFQGHLCHLPYVS